MYQPQQQH